MIIYKCNTSAGRINAYKVLVPIRIIIRSIRVYVRMPRDSRSGCFSNSHLLPLENIWTVNFNRFLPFLLFWRTANLWASLHALFTRFENFFNCWTEHQSCSRLSASVSTYAPLNVHGMKPSEIGDFVKWKSEQNEQECSTSGTIHIRRCVRLNLAPLHFKMTVFLYNILYILYILVRVYYILITCIYSHLSSSAFRLRRSISKCTQRRNHHSKLLPQKGNS